MAERQQRDSVNTGQNSEQNANSNMPDPSNYAAWTQYWQYYYSYYMYYYTSYYYMALCQNSAGFAVANPNSVGHAQRTTAELNGSRVQRNNQPEPRDALVNGGIFRVVDLRPRNQPVERYEYKVASLRKRLFAEFIDFVFLYFLKYMLFLLYYKDPDLLNNQFQHILIIDENATIKDLEDVIIQAVIYRLLVFVYEAFFIAAPFPCKIGGATLGKYMMGITIVLYPSLTPIEGHNLRRFTGNAQRLSLWQSCVRATLKNFLVTLFFPIIFTTMFLQNFRTPYDFIACSVVVDAHPKRLTDSAQRN